MAPYSFREDDINNLEIVRQIVLQRLKADKDWQQFDWWDMNVDHLVRFESSRLRERFLVLVQEVMWQLIIQNVLTPGINAHNLNLPWFRITDYGRTVLDEETFVPHDPTDYMKRVREHARTTITEPTFTYLGEALRCFNAGCHTASVLLLGIAAESAIIQCFDAMVSTLSDTKQIDKCRKMAFIKVKHEWIMDQLRGIEGAKRRAFFSGHASITLTSMYDLIRQQRNDLGHPQSAPPDINREAAYVHFQLFPLIVECAEELAEFARQGGL